MHLKRTAGLLLVVLALLQLAETSHADRSMLLDAVLTGTSKQHSKASMMGARGGHKEAAVVAFQTASWNDCLYYLSTQSPYAETQLTCDKGWESKLGAAQSPALKCSWNIGALLTTKGGSFPGDTTRVPDTITRVGIAQGICTVQHEAEDCLAARHGRVPLCAGITISIDAGVFLVPALLKDNNYKMPIGDLGSSSSSSSTGADDSCCILNSDASPIFPDYVKDLKVCTDFFSENKNSPSVPPAINSNRSSSSSSSSSSGGRGRDSGAAKGPSAPAPAAKGTAGSAARAERYHGSRDTPNEGYYEGVAMVVSGPMYIANWDTQQDWEVTGMMDWVPWANAIGEEKTGPPDEKLIHVHPGLNRFKFFKEAPARYQGNTPAHTAA